MGSWQKTRIWLCKNCQFPFFSPSFFCIGVKKIISMEREWMKTLYSSTKAQQTQKAIIRTEFVRFNTSISFWGSKLKDLCYYNLILEEGGGNDLAGLSLSTVTTGIIKATKRIYSMAWLWYCNHSRLKGCSALRWSLCIWSKSLSLVHFPLI